MAGPQNVTCSPRRRTLAVLANAAKSVLKSGESVSKMWDNF